MASDTGLEKRPEGEVLLEITGGNGEITTKTEAMCYYKNGSYYLLFEEDPDPETKGGVIYASRLKIRGDEVKLRRSVKSGAQDAGKAVMELVYRKGTSGGPGIEVDYPSPYGVMKLEIRTHELMIREHETALEVMIGYSLFQAGKEASRDLIVIRACKKTST